MNSICVYCGSSPGRLPVYLQAARQLGEAIAARDLKLVYGGASVGLMGEVARAALERGGKVTGVIPKALADQEVAFLELDDLYVVETMHARKALMAELSDGFITLPGGMGTLEEFFEVLTWAQLGIHRKPCGLLNIQGYFDQLLRFLDHAASEDFIWHAHCDLILMSDNPDELLDRFLDYQPPEADKAAWVLRMSRKGTAD
jgi:uncharacterized protein (TIGR00730 family)